MNQMHLSLRPEPVAAGAVGSVSRAARRWAARMCVADDPDDLSRVLSLALLDLGYEAVTVLRRDPDHGVAACWSRMDGQPVDLETPMMMAQGELLSKLPGRVHDWVARQDKVLTLDDFLDLDRRTYSEFVQVPRDFGLPCVTSKVTVPYTMDNRGLSLGVASMSWGDGFRDQLPDVRFLAQLYFSLADDLSGGAPDAAERVDLTPRQVECLRWAAAGKAYEDIATILGISERGVRYHLNKAREAFGFATITQTIVQAARQYGLDPTDAR